MLECPDLAHQGVKEDAPPNELFYDMISVLKHNLCNDITITGPGGPTTYTPMMQAILPGDAAECMGPNGNPYDRIKVLEELTIGVKILGSPVDKSECKNAYLRDNVDSDVGIKDLIKLLAYGMTDFPVVALVDYTFLSLKSLSPVIEAFMNSGAPVAYTMDYTPPGVVPTSNNQGVNTGFMLVKPDEAELTNIKNVYKTSDFDPATGWDNSGIGGFPGAMGCGGLLRHYYENKTSKKPMILDKCHFGNDYEYHLDSNGKCRDGTDNCANCQATPEDEIVVAKLNNKVCGKPFECPDSSHMQGSCKAFHKKWFQDRDEYEKKHFKGGRRAERTGTFETDVTLGFCEKAGKEGYEKLLPDADSGPLPVPEPKTQASGCQNTCGQGQYLTQDCTCSSDECDACPEGTRCQKKANGAPALCIDCGCGFCDFAGNACCNFNGVNNCKSATNKKECLLQNAYYPGWPGTGNACSGVEISATAVPNGCGCQPNELTPCTYDASGGGDKCFIVTAHELLASHPQQSNVADACKACVDQCDPCVSGDGQADVTDMMNCLGKTIGKKRESLPFQL